MSRVFLHFSIFLSFNSCCTHLSVFWIFPISCGRLDKLVDWYPISRRVILCLRIIFAQQCLQFHIFEFYDCFPCFLSSFLSCVEVTTFETPKPSFARILRWSMFTISYLRKSIWFSSSFLQMKTQNYCCRRMLFGRYKFRHTVHNNILLSTQFSNLSHVRVWHLVVQQNGAVSNFLAQTALVRHLFSEIRISYLYT